MYFDFGKIFWQKSNQISHKMFLKIKKRFGKKVDPFKHCSIAEECDKTVYNCADALFARQMALVINL